MKIKSYKIGAVIPTCQYGNLQPVIELEGESLDEMKEVGLDHIKELHSRFSEKELNETVKSVVSSTKMKSWNEDIEVEMTEDHKYFYEGKRLESGSKFASSFYKKFDADGIAKNCEKSWGVPAQDIQDMWKSGGNVSSDFGSAIHQALEHYFNHRNTAKTIGENKKDDEDRAMPKHPILKKIVTDFVELAKIKDTVVTEAFVTYVKGSKCGQIDQLIVIDEKKKICDIHDFKINVESEDISSNHKASAPYDTLPNNKLTKYYIQMKFYKEVLEATGWTVRNLKAFVYEEEWKMFDLTNLEMVDIKKETKEK